MNIGWILNEYWMNTEWILNEYWINIEWILKEYWVNIEWILNKYWINIEWILNEFWMNIDCINEWMKGCINDERINWWNVELDVSNMTVFFTNLLNCDQPVREGKLNNYWFQIKKIK